MVWQENLYRIGGGQHIFLLPKGQVSNCDMNMLTRGGNRSWLMKIGGWAKALSCGDIECCSTHMICYHSSQFQDQAVTREGEHIEPHLTNSRVLNASLSKDKVLRWRAARFPQLAAAAAACMFQRMLSC